MAIAPHLHFEAQDGEGRPYNPEAFLRAFLPAEAGRTVVTTSDPL